MVPVTKTYVLQKPEPVVVRVPELDDAQQRVVDHRGGPLLVLAGPGTGKTTTLVEVVARRLIAGELAADQVLMLTFSRKAAQELRARITSRVGGTHRAVQAATFHSFCHGLVREFGTEESWEGPAELMTAPERDGVIRELLAGHQASSWPESLREALGTRGFAAEVQVFMDRVSALGLTAEDVRRRATALDRPVWARLADLIAEYRDVIALRNMVDYPGLIDRAIVLASDPSIRAQLRQRFRLVVVDEYQDTDPQQVELLRHLAGGGAELIVVGDPDQSIYAFRGGDQRGILRFTEQFATSSAPVPVVPLRTTRRFGSEILRATQRTLAGLPLGVGAVGEAVRQHRDLTSISEDPGRVEVRTFVSPTAEGEHLAAMLRRAHLDDGLSWSDMAVLVRSAAEITRLSRVLIPSGVPVEVAGDEIPLIAEPAVHQLLCALEAADILARGDTLSTEHAHQLLTGPLGGLDASMMRRVGRVLRRREPEVSSAELLARALHEPTLLGVDHLVRGDQVAARAMTLVRDLAALLARAAEAIRAESPPEHALWELWNGTAWPGRLRRQWESGGEARVLADRGLDAIAALFRHAARAEEQGRRRSVPNLLADLRAQQIPADQLSSEAVSRDAVRIMTAHRSKGLEWSLVVVAGVQEGTWPNFGTAGSLLRTEQLDAAQAQTRGAQLREERRLFYVACTRARSRLVVTAVASPTDDGDHPSRFLEELATEFAADPVGHEVWGRPPQPVSLRGVISQLRRWGENPEATAEERAHAAHLLSRIAATGLPSAAAAHPDRWWGLADITHAPEPVLGEGAPLRLSASSVDSITTCPLRWFLSRQAHGELPSDQSAHVGSVIHAIAHDLASRDEDPNEKAPDVDAMIGHLDSIWNLLGHESSWQSRRARQEAVAMVERLHTWHQMNPRTVLGTEFAFEIDAVIDDQDVILRGSMDRVEQDTRTGAVHVVDLKTGSTAPSAKSAGEHAQLGFYQFAVHEGATAELAADAPVGGAELVYVSLPHGARRPTEPKVIQQEALGPDSVVHDQLAHAVRVMRNENFTATPQDQCRHCHFRSVCPATSEMTVGGES